MLRPDKNIVYILPAFWLHFDCVLTALLAVFWLNHSVIGSNSFWGLVWKIRNCWKTCEFKNNSFCYWVRQLYGSKLRWKVYENRKPILHKLCCRSRNFPFSNFHLIKTTFSQNRRTFVGNVLKIDRKLIEIGHTWNGNWKNMLVHLKQK